MSLLPQPSSNDSEELIYNYSIPLPLGGLFRSMHFAPFPKFPCRIKLQVVALHGSWFKSIPYVGRFSSLYHFPLLYLCSLHLPNTPLARKSSLSLLLGEPKLGYAQIHFEG